MVERRVTQYMARFWYAILVLLKNRPAQIPLSASSRRGRLPRFSSPDACSSVISLSRVEKIQVINATMTARSRPVRTGCAVRILGEASVSIPDTCLITVLKERIRSISSVRSRMPMFRRTFDKMLLLINCRRIPPA